MRQIPSFPVSEEVQEHRLALVHGPAFEPREGGVVCVRVHVCVQEGESQRVCLCVCAVCVCVIYKCKDNSKFLVGTKWGTVKYEK